MKRAACTWGDGPDVLLVFEDDYFMLYEDPKHNKPPQGSPTHGYVTKGSADLTVDEALTLAFQLTEAANNAKELDRMCEEHDEAEGNNSLTEEEVKAMNDIPLETLTCHNCKDRDDCPYVDDVYNTSGDCLASKQVTNAETKRKQEV